MSENTNVNETAADLVLIEDDARPSAAVLDGLREGAASIISTNQSEDFASKVAMFAAVQSSEDVSDHLNETIWLTDVIAEAVRFQAVLDPKTGQVTQEASDGARVTLVTEDGLSFTASSKVLVNDLSRLFASVGQPHTWQSALPIIIKEEGKAPRKYFTVKIDVAAFQKRQSAK